MENLRITQQVADRRASFVAQAQQHRLSKELDEPARREPRLRYQRRLRPAVHPRRSPA